MSGLWGPRTVDWSKMQIIIIIFLLSPAFSKKSGGTLFLVFSGAWCVARGRGSEFLVGTLSP